MTSRSLAQSECVHALHAGVYSLHSSARARSMDFSTSLLSYHLGKSPASSLRTSGRRFAEDEVDGVLSTDGVQSEDGALDAESEEISRTLIPSRTILDCIMDLNLTKERLQLALLDKPSNEDINELHPRDGLAVLHRLVIEHYKHRVQLIMTLIMFSSANMNLKTSHGKTAFQLSVEVGDVRVMELLASLGADIDLHTNYKPSRPRQLAEQRATLHSAVIPHEYIPTELEYNITSWATDHFGIQCSSPFVYDSSLPKTTNSPNMKTALRELGVNHKTVKTPKIRVPTVTASCMKHRGSACGCDLTKYAITSLLPKTRWRQTKQIQPSLTSNRDGVRVLCLDGGGMRGLVQLEILRQIEQIIKLAGNYNNITDMFDYIVGTSTGGVTALALVYGCRTIRELQQLYLRIKEDVFTSKGFFEIEKANTEKLEHHLKLWLGEDRYMDQVQYPKVLVSAVSRESTSVDLQWFSNFLGDRNSRKPVWKVGRYTSAAPFYFRSLDNYIDGGLLANNPSLHALTTIQNHLRREGHGRKVSLVVSIGTGINPQKDYRDLNITNYFLYCFRNVRLLEFMSSIMVERHAMECEESCRSMCVEQNINYVRLNPTLDTEIDSGETDDKKLLDMLWTTRKYMNHSLHKLDTIKQFYTNPLAQ